MTIEGILKIGEQVIRIFSKNGDLIAEKLRENDYRVTVFEGSGRDGIVKLLFVQAKRRKVSKVIDIARNADPNCFMILDDIRSVHMANRSPKEGGDLLPIAPLITNESK